MTEETKKQILLHLPYLFFAYAGACKAYSKKGKQPVR